jgi:hypothetical protein
VSAKWKYRPVSTLSDKRLRWFCAQKTTVSWLLETGFLQASFHKSFIQLSFGAIGILSVGYRSPNEQGE